MGRYMSVLCGKHTTEIALLVTHLPLWLCWENNTKSERRKTCVLNWHIGHINEGLFFPSNSVRNLRACWQSSISGFVNIWHFWQSENAGITSPAGCLMEAFLMSVTKEGSQAWVECTGALLLFNWIEGRLREATTGSVGEQRDAGLWGMLPSFHK